MTDKDRLELIDNQKLRKRNLGNDNIDPLLVANKKHMVVTQTCSFETKIPHHGFMSTLREMTSLVTVCMHVCLSVQSHKLVYSVCSQEFKGNEDESVCSYW